MDILRKPIAFLVTIALLFGTFCVPGFADDQTGSGAQLYNEDSISNGIDTGFEKQSEIAEVKAHSYDGIRTLSTDSHSGRFSLKVGKAGLTGSAICNIINSVIDLSKYNQVSMWVKTKGLSKVSIYIRNNGVNTIIGESEVVKQGEWSQVTFDLSKISSGAIDGIYCYGEAGKTILIDDIKFAKSYKHIENWNLSGGAVGTNTLSTLNPYLSGSAMSMSSDLNNVSSGNNNVNVAYIENPVAGQISGVKIESSNLNNLVTNGEPVYLDCVPPDNNTLFALSANGKVAYYYNSSGGAISPGAIIRKDYTTNDTDIVTFEATKKLLTNEDGSLLALVKSDGSLYYYDAAVAKTNTTYSQELVNSMKMNSVSYLTTVSAIAVQDVFIEGDDIYYNYSGYLYKFKKGEKSSSVVLYMQYYDSSQNLSNGQTSIYRGSVTSKGSSQYLYTITRNGSTIYQSATVSSTTAPTGGIEMINPNGTLLLFQFNNEYYILKDPNTTTISTASVKALGSAITNPCFLQGDRIIYYRATELYEAGYSVARHVASIYTSIDADENSGDILFAENNCKLSLISKTFSYDKELIIDFRSLTGSTIPLTDNAIIEKVMFSTIPNQAFVQMKNGDIYSVDLKTKTCRIILTNMLLCFVLSDGKILVSERLTFRYLIFDPVTSDKQVFTISSRSSNAFKIFYNEKEKTVFFVNNSNKMQQILLTGAESKARYAFMFNGDGRYWVYKNNTWRIIYTGTGNPSAEIMDSQGMNENEVNSITEGEFRKLVANTGAGTLRIAVYFDTNSGQAIPVLNGIQVMTKDIEAELAGKTAYGTRIKEYNKAEFRNISAIHVTENKDLTDEIYYFLVVNDTPYSIRNGEVCSISQSAVQLFSNVKEKYIDIMTYGMSAKELSDFPADKLKEILITNNTADKFGIVAVIKTIDKDTKDVKLDYVLESLQKRFDDAATTIQITLTDDTLIQYAAGEVTKEEIERFADWVADRKYNRGPVFFTFHVGGKYKVINYYMIKMFSVE